MAERGGTETAGRRIRGCGTSLALGTRSADRREHVGHITEAGRNREATRSQIRSFWQRFKRP